jgi:hypothetical protein
MPASLAKFVSEGTTFWDSLAWKGDKFLLLLLLLLLAQQGGHATPWNAFLHFQ